MRSQRMKAMARRERRSPGRAPGRSSTTAIPWACPTPRRCRRRIQWGWTTSLFTRVIRMTEPRYDVAPHRLRANPRALELAWADFYRGSVIRITLVNRDVVHPHCILLRHRRGIGQAHRIAVVEDLLGVRRGDRLLRRVMALMR